MNALEGRAGGSMTVRPTSTTGDSAASPPKLLDHRTLALESIGHLRAITASLYNPETYGPVRIANDWLTANDQSVQELLGHETDTGSDPEGR